MSKEESKQLVLEKILDRPAKQVLQEFGDGKASPGSGSAAALLSILSARMIITVCKISRRKDECSEFHNQFEYIAEEVADNHEKRLQEIFENDAEDFEKIVEIRKKRDKATDKVQKAKLSREALDLLEDATENIFEIAEISFKLVKYGISMYEDGWEHVRGDSGVAISAALSSIMSAVFIINLNLKTLRRRNYAAEAVERSQDLEERLNEAQANAFSYISSISSESLESIQLELNEE